MNKRIFVSSTFKDLEPYRQAVRDSIRQLGAVDISMEHFGARDERPLDECLRSVREESDVFVGIYAHRYGFVPDGETISIPEAEYNAATERILPRLIYILDEDTPWGPKLIDKGEASTKLETFKSRLLKNHVCGFFTSPDDLARKVAADVERLSSEQGRDTDITANIRASDTVAQTRRYLDHIITLHQYLPVAGFGTNLRIPIPLDKVYVHLQARMTEVQRALAPEARGKKPDYRQLETDKTVTAQKALQYAIDKHYDGLVILGQPGSGKTTLAKYFALCFSSGTAKDNLGIDSQFLPILLFLRHIDPTKSLVQNIRASLHGYALDLDDKFFLDQLRSGRTILFFDGLDEVPTEEKRAEVSNWIHNAVHLAFPESPVVVTSRFAGYRGDAVLPGAYLRLEILDFELPLIKQFIENWIAAVEIHLHEDSDHWRTEAQRVAYDLYKRIGSTPVLKELASNPLMLQVIALMHRDRGLLPHRRVELYKECIDVMLERWDKAKGLDVRLSASQARRVLQRLALWTHLVENRNEVSQMEIVTFIEPILATIKKGVNPIDLLRSWEERSGILSRDGDSFAFQHRSFQEYLVAEQINVTGKHDILAKNFNNPWWHEPTLLAMGLMNPSDFSHFMRLLLHETKNNGGEIDFMLRCIDEVLVKKAEPFIDALTTSSTFESKYCSLLALERIDTRQAKMGVRSALQDSDSRVTDLARSILAKWGEIPVDAEKEIVSVQIEGKTFKLPARTFNPVEHDAEYIFIPGGKHKYSLTEQEITIWPFHMAKYPVTNKQYRRFVHYLRGEKPNRGVHALSLDNFTESLIARANPIEGMLKEIGDNPSRWSQTLISRYDSDRRFNGDDLPVVGVSWYAAVAYCHWLTEMTGKTNPVKSHYRLPTEIEWEWAAGGGKRAYPWGKEEPDEKRANYGRKVGQTTPVGAYPVGATAEGLMDMAGNVWEWMDNPDKKYEGSRALRGGSWFDPAAEYLRCEARTEFVQGSWGFNFGFRVVQSWQDFYRDSLLDELDKSRDENARCKAASLLSAWPEDIIRDSLLDHAKNDDSLEIRLACCEALCRGWWREPQIRRWIRERIANEGSAQLRERLMRAVRAERSHLSGVWESRLSNLSAKDKGPQTLPGYPAFRVLRFRIRDIGPFLDTGEVELRSDINVFLGDNAAGKTTLMRCLALAAIGLAAANEVGEASSYLRRGPTR